MGGVAAAAAADVECIREDGINDPRGLRSTFGEK